MLTRLRASLTTIRAQVWRNCPEYALRMIFFVVVLLLLATLYGLFYFTYLAF